MGKFISRVAIIFLVVVITCSASTAKYSGGSGTPEDPYRISDYNDLYTLADDTNDYDKNFVMVNDIDLNPNLPGRRSLRTALIAPDISSNASFQGPLFRGVFNGNGFRIRNLVIDASGYYIGGSYLGFFGKVGDGVVINLCVEDVNIIGSSRNFNVGGLIGDNEYGGITNCYATGVICDVNRAVGGLVGENSEGASIFDCGANVTVTFGKIVGGLVGQNYGAINGSHAIGPVEGNQNVGGLVGENEEAVISNCYATGDVSGQRYVGGLVGWTHYGSITNSYSTGYVTGGPDSHDLGGLVGNCWYGSVTNCFATGSVSGGDDSYYIGGLAGVSLWGRITNCYATGSVTGGIDSMHVGGLMGRAYGGSVVSCYATGSVSGDSTVGGLVGYAHDGTIADCYFLDPNDGGGPDNGVGTPLTDEQMRLQSSFVNWSFRNGSPEGYCYYWFMPEDAYPVLGICCGYTPEPLNGSGTVDDPYLIADANDLGSVWYRPSAHYRLTNDVSLTGINWPTAPVPVFGGSFDGNGHAVVGLSINGGDFLGLFGQATDNAHVTNLDIEDANIVAGYYSSYLGGLAGRNDGYITDCYANTTIKAGDDSYYLGGLVGYCYEANITDCSTISSLTAGSDSHSLGGLGGRIFRTSVTGCSSNASIDAANNSNGLGGLLGDSWLSNTHKSYAAGDVTGYASLGGLVGNNSGNYEYITSSCAAVTVTGYGHIGGLIGHNSSCDINDCFATGPVNASSSYVGGLVGSNYNADISRCYSVGDVNASALYVGGFIGHSDSYYLPGPTISDCFWNTEIQTHGVTQSIGYSYHTTVINVAGLSTLEMKQQASFAPWDFDNVWDICEGTNYPRLIWQIPSGDFLCPDGVNFIDYARFGKWWLYDTCIADNDFCSGADFDMSGIVDEKDAIIFCNNWLDGFGP